MKRVYYIFTSLIFLAAACVREIPISIEEPLTEPTVPVVLSFDQPVTLQAATKADADMLMAETPSISSIHVAVFGSSGYLKDYTSATPCKSDGTPISNFATTNGTANYFLARLPVSTSRRIVHIIANGPSSLEFNAYEGDIMKNLSVTDGIGAYWQRIDLTGGITVETTTNTAGQTVYAQDSNGEYIPTSATTAAFSGIKLVRNFAGVTVTDSADNFELISYTLCNMPKSGSVAIYSTNHNDWVSDYCDKNITSDTGIMTFDGHDYAGFPDDPELNTYIPDTEARFNAQGVSYAKGETTYVYERAAVRNNPPFILMAAKWVETGDPSGATVKYYRLDITKGAEYFPLYRNYHYTLNITGCDIEGYADPGTAAKHNSGSNFSVSMDTQELNEIANKKVRLNVEKTNYDLLYTSDAQELWFQFIKNEGSVNLNDNVTVTEEDGGDAILSSTLEGSDRAADGKRYFTYTLKEPGTNEVLTSTLKIVGSYTEGGKDYQLSREVNIRTLKPRSVTPTLNPDVVANLAGQSTTLTIPLPLDMPKSMFPMEILIEDSQKALNPASSEDMPVRTDIKSLTDNTTPSYCFVRTLNWSEYERIVKDASESGLDSAPMTCKFVTIKPFSPSTTIYVANTFFSKTAGVTDTKVDLTADASDFISPNDQTFKGTTAHVNVNASGNWALSIKLANGNAATGVTMSPHSGTDTGGTPVDVTLTFAENDSESAIRYLLTLTNTDTDETRIAYLTQEGVSMALRTEVTTPVVPGGVNNFVVKVKSGGSYKLQTIDTDGEVLWTGSTYAATENETDREVTIPQTNTNVERKVTVRLINTYETIWRDIKVTQSAGTASITLAESEIRKGATSNTATISTNINTVMKVYNTDGSSTLLSEIVSPSASETITVGENTSGADRHFRVDLCNTKGRVLSTASFTQINVPALVLTATGSTSIGSNDTSVSLNVDSEAAWTVSVTGGLGGTLSPASGFAGSTNAVTLTVPVNNTTTAKTYTVTADNGSAYDYPHKTVTINQAAGVASLAVVDSEIMMQETTARVSVTTSFPTVLKVFNADTDVLVQEQNIASTNSAASQQTVTVGDHTGSAINYRVELWNTSGVQVGNTINFVQKPMIRISAPSTSVAGNANASVTVTSDVDWTLSSTNGGTFGAYSGTRCSNENVTVNMPVNYTTSDVIFTVTAQGTVDTSLSASVAITHRKASASLNQSVTFSTQSDASHTRYSTTNKTVTQNGITGTFGDNIYSVGATYMRITTETTVRLYSVDAQKTKIKGVDFSYTTDGYTPDDCSASVAVAAGTQTSCSSSGGDWSGNATDFTVTLKRSTSGQIRLTQYVVTYDAYTWD